MSSVVVRLIRVYQKWCSPFLKLSCRFHPSCSEYAVLAIEHYGLFRAIGFVFLRLIKCHPWHEGGADPIK